MSLPPQLQPQPPTTSGPQPASPSTSSTSSQPTPDIRAAEADPALYEQTHVHKVYSQIAPHFSATRHKPWPLIARFLLSQPPGSVGLDVGCGNGKYLGVNGDVYLVGSDRSEELVRLAREGLDVRVEGGKDDGGKGGEEEKSGEGQGGKKDGGEREGGRRRREKREVMTADGLALPFREGCADFVICVAVLHHFSTKQRRVDGIRALLRCVRPMSRGEEQEGGKVMVFVWALEQASSRRGWDEGADQDQLVPWVMKPPQQKKKRGKGKVDSSGGSEKGGEDEGEGEVKEEEKTFQRYYHLYRKGELEEDVEAAGGLVLESGYDRDNWWVIAANVTS